MRIHGPELPRRHALAALAALPLATPALAEAAAGDEPAKTTLLREQLEALAASVTALDAVSKHGAALSGLACDLHR